MQVAIICLQHNIDDNIKEDIFHGTKNTGTKLVHANAHTVLKKKT